MTSLGWTLIQYGRCPHKKGKFGHGDTHRRMPCEKEGRDGDDASTSQKSPKIASNHLQPRAWYGTNSLSWPSEGTKPVNIFISHF